ncbi:MAG: UPF0175 family protein [Tangfeifania sp.]
MNTQTISIDIPSDILLALNESEDEFKNKIKILLAIRLYQQEKLTIGKAAQLCGLSHLDFESLLSDNEISISNLSIDEIIEDSKKLK